MEQLGVSEFLEKPFSEEMLWRSAKKAIGAPKAASLSPADPPVSPMILEEFHLLSDRESVWVWLASGIPLHRMWSCKS